MKYIRDRKIGFIEFDADIPENWRDLIYNLKRPNPVAIIFIIVGILFIVFGTILE